MYYLQKRLLKKYNYGPLNVDEPGDYWKNIAKYWKTTETAAKKYRLVTLKPTEKNESQTDIIAQERLQKALSTKVRVRRGRRGGTLVLSWYDDRQLEQIVNQIVDSTSQKLDQVPARIDI